MYHSCHDSDFRSRYLPQSYFSIDEEMSYYELREQLQFQQLIAPSKIGVKQTNQIPNKTPGGSVKRKRQEEESVEQSPCKKSHQEKEASSFEKPLLSIPIARPGALDHIKISQEMYSFIVNEWQMGKSHRKINDLVNNIFSTSLNQYSFKKVMQAVTDRYESIEFKERTKTQIPKND